MIDTFDTSSHEICIEALLNTVNKQWGYKIRSMEEAIDQELFYHIFTEIVQVPINVFVATFENWDTIFITFFK